MARPRLLVACGCLSLESPEHGVRYVPRVEFPPWRDASADVGASGRVMAGKSPAIVEVNRS